MKQIKSSQDIQSLALEIAKKEEQLAEYSNELTAIMEAQTIFSQYRDAQKQLEDFRKQFNEAAKKFLKQTGQKSSEGPAGRITLTQRNYYSVEDENLLPDEYKDLPKLEKRAKDIRADIKRDFEIFNSPVSGIKQKTTESILWTKPKNSLEKEA